MYRIENYSILLATCAPVVRLFIRMLLDNHNRTGSYWSHSRSHHQHEGFELDKDDRGKSKHAVSISTFADRDRSLECEREREIEHPSSQRRQNGQEEHNQSCIRVNTDITVHVDSDGASTKRLVQ